jgi:hypothetical protein
LYAKEEDLQELQTGGNKSMKKNSFERCCMAIRWLMPLKRTSFNDFILLYQDAIVFGKDEDKKLYLGPTSRGGQNGKHTLVLLANM